MKTTMEDSPILKLSQAREELNALIESSHDLHARCWRVREQSMELLSRCAETRNRARRLEEFPVDFEPPR